MLQEAPILHPGASFRNPEAGFRISEARSRGSFHGESARSGVPRVERGGGASCNNGKIQLISLLLLKYLVHWTHCVLLFCCCTPTPKWIIARWFPQEWKRILILRSPRRCCHDPFTNMGLSFQFPSFGFIHSLTWSKSTRCSQQMPFTWK
jgi:hypothetical protein